MVKPLLVSCAAALAASACSFSFGGGPDYQKLESGIADQLNGTYAPIDLKVSSVDCPEQSDLKAGSTFDCTADVGGLTVRIAVTVSDDDYNVDFVTRDTVYDLAASSATLTSEVSDKLGFPVEVDCGEGFTAVETEQTFDCTATDPQGEERTLRVTAAPIGGNDSWELLP